MSRRMLAAAPITPEASSATQQPRGSCRTRCSIRARQLSARSGDRCSGSGQPVRCVRTSRS